MAPAVGTAPPHHQGSGSRVESYVSLVVVHIGEFKASLALLHDEPYVAGRLRMEPDRKVLMRSGVMLAAAPSQDLTEDVDGVRGQIGLAQQLVADVVIADDVPSMDGELVPQMGYEFSHDHLSPGPWNDRMGLGSQDLIYQ